MIITQEYIKDYLNQQWNKYFRSSVFYGVGLINNVPTEIYRDYLTYIKNNFIQDIQFEYFYKGYVIFISNKYKNCNINYLNEKSFEKHLQDVKLKTYVIMEDDYNVCKYICFDNYLKQKLY